MCVNDMTIADKCTFILMQRWKLFDETTMHAVYLLIVVFLQTVQQFSQLTSWTLQLQPECICVSKYRYTNVK